jgi:hypothetical protein
MANLIGEKEDALYYSNMVEEIKMAFNAKFFDPVTKVYSTGSQTAYSMPLFFGMVDDSCKKDVVGNLIKSINENNKPIRELKEVKIINETDGKTMCEISSGEYFFKTPYIK